MALSIATTRFGSNLTNYDGTSTNASCGVSVTVDTTAIIAVVVIYDASSTDGIISDMTIGSTGSGFKTMTKADEYYDATCGGHVSIWYLNAVWDGSYGMSLDPTLGGTVTDWWSAAMVIEGGQIAVDAIATEATGNGSATITWSTVETDTIAVSCALSDQSVATRITANDTTFDDLSSAGAEDLGNDSAMAAYAVRTSSGSQTIDWSDSDNDEDWVAIGVSFKEDNNPLSSKSAYLTGPVNVTDNQSAFMVGAVGQVYRIDVEEGNLTDFNGTIGDVSVNSTSPMVGSYDVQVDISSGDTNDDYANKLNNQGMVAVSLRFYMNHDSMSFATGESLRAIQGRTDITPSSFLYFGPRDDAGTIKYYLTLTDDESNDQSGTYITAPTGDVCIEIHLVSETYDGADDGYAEWWINGTKQANRTNWSQNYNVIRNLAQIDYGNNARSSANVNGTLYLDDIILRDDGAYIGFDPVNTSDSQSAYTEGASAATASDNQSAYLKGQDTASDNQSAYTKGQDTALSNKSAFLCGIPSGWQFLFHDGFESNDTSAWTSETDPNSELTTSTQSAMGGTYGMQIVVNDSDDIYVTLDTADNIVAMQIEFMFDPNDAAENDLGETELFYVDMPSWTGFGTDNVFGLLYNDATDGPPQLRAWAADGDDGDKWYTTFQNITQGPNKIRVVWDSFGSPDIEFYVDDTFKASYSAGAFPRKAEVLYLGVPTTKANNGTLYFDQVWIFVKYSAEDNQSAYLKGQDTASDNQAAFLQGSIDTLDNQTAYLVGQDSALDNTPAYTEGIASAIDNVPAYLAAEDTAIDNTPAYLVGSIDVTDNKSAYLEGDLVLVTDNKSAYLVGEDTALDNQAAYLVGSIDITDNQIAYLQGQDTSLDNQIAYLKGSVNTSDNQTAYLEGADSATDNKSAFLHGSVDVTDNVPAYLIGQDTAVDNIPAYTVGGIVVTDNQPGYTKGQDTSSDNQIAYLLGSVNIADNQVGYLQGQDTTLDNISAYLIGQDTATDNVSAFTVGSINITDNASAYLQGQDLASDSISGYTSGGIASSDNSPAYILATGEILPPTSDISQSGSWKKEDAGTTNLYVSIDEQPGPNDTDYVWHQNVSGSEYFEVALADPSGASVGAGDVTIYWRGYKNGPKTVTMRIQLREGTTIIAQSDEVFSGSFISYSYTLSSGEKSSITDWTNLRLRFIVQGVV